MNKISLLIILIFTLTSCFQKEDYTPKPKTYLRLDVSQPQYILHNDNSLPYKFEYPDYGKIEKVENNPLAKHWLNINFPEFGCMLYLSYKDIKGDIRLDKLVNDSYTFLKEHQKLSSGIIESEYRDDDKKVYGFAFEIKGKEVASPYQFYLTDSNNHFVRGAIYFDFKVNNDSLMPIIERLNTDLNHLISTFEFTK